MRLNHIYPKYVFSIFLLTSMTTLIILNRQMNMIGGFSHLKELRNKCLLLSKIFNVVKTPYQELTPDT